MVDNNTIYSLLHIQWSKNWAIGDVVGMCLTKIQSSHKYYTPRWAVMHGWQTATPWVRQGVTSSNPKIHCCLLVGPRKYLFFTQTILHYLLFLKTYNVHFYSPKDIALLFAKTYYTSILQNILHFYSPKHIALLFSN